jgi:hypothetical protein
MSSGTKAIMANITGGKIMKVRWNACYAASNILRKEEEEGQWRTDLINCLLDMVINFHNFKVISAQSVSQAYPWRFHCRAAINPTNGRLSFFVSSICEPVLSVSRWSQIWI